LAIKENEKRLRSMCVTSAFFYEKYVAESESKYIPDLFPLLGLSKIINKFKVVEG
jgi:hypothetical protein